MDEKLVVSLEVDASQAAQGVQQYDRELGRTLATTKSIYKASSDYNELIGDSGHQHNLASQYIATYGKSLESSTNKGQKYLDNLRKMALRLQEYSRELVKAENKERDLTIVMEQMQRKYNETHLEGTLDVSKYEAEIQRAVDAQVKYGTSFEMTLEAMERLEGERVEYISSLETENAATEKVIQSQKDFSENTESVSRNLVSMATSAASSAASMGGADGIANVLSAAGTSMRAIMSASGPAGLAIAAITVAFQGLKLAVGVIQDEIEATREYFNRISSAAENAATTAQEITQARDYLSTIQSMTATLSEQKTARDALIAQFPQFVSFYNSEGEAVLKSNKAIQEEIALQERLLKIEQQRLLNSTHLKPTYLGIVASKKEEIALLDQEITKQQEIVALANEKVNAFEGGPHSELAAYQEEAYEAARVLEGLVADQTTAYEKMWEAARLAADITYAQYQEQVDALGTLDEVKQRIAENTMRDALEEQMTVEAFNALLADRLTNEQLLAQTSAVIASEKAREAAETENAAEAVKTYADMLSLAQKAQDTGRYQKYVDVLKAGRKETDEYAEALSAVAKRLGISNDELESSVGMYGRVIEKLDATTVAEYNAMIAALDLEIAALNASIANGALGDTIVQQMIEQLGLLQQMRAELAAVAGAVGEPISSPKGGGGSSREEQKAAWELELELIERVKSEMSDLGDIYIATLEKLSQNQRLSAEERERYERELSYAMKAVDGTLEEDYIAYLEKILDAEKLNADQRLEVEKKLIAAQKDLQQQRIAELNALGNAVVEALRAKYEAQRAAEEEAATASATARQKAHNEEIKAINERRDAAIKAINAERDARLEAISAEIAALDAAWQARQRANEDEDYDAQLARLRRQLELTKDEYSQKKTLEEIARVEEKRTETEAKRAYDDEKKRLQDEASAVRDSATKQIEAVRDSAQAQIDSINAVREAEQEALAARTKENEAYWEQRLSDEALKLEAVRVLNQESNEDILQLLKDYNPDYLQAGLDLGQMLYDGMNEKYADLLSRTKSVAAEIIRTMKEAMAYVGGGSSSSSSYSGGSGTQSVTPYSTESLIQTIAAVPDLVDMAITGALENMMASPRAYAAAKAEEAYAAGATTFALADLNMGRTAVSGASGGTGTPSQQLAMAGYSGRRIENINMVIQAPSQSPYEQQRAARLELERWEDNGWI